MNKDPDNTAPQVAEEQAAPGADEQGGESVLSEEELDALQTSHAPTDQEAGVCHAYDFRDPARILNGRLPGMDSVNEAFTQAMEDSLRRFLRRAVTVQSGETLLSRQSDYLTSLPMPASVQSARLPSQESTIFVTLEGGLVYACVDAYFGGRGSEMPDDPEREFSASERRVTHLVTQLVLEEFKSAWATMCVLEFIMPQAVNLTASGTGQDDQILVVIKFKVELNPGCGEFHVVLPYTLLDTLRPLLTAAPRNGESDQQWLSKLQQRVWKISVDTYSLFQDVDITIGELMALQPGDFIPIPEQNQITVMVDELPLYDAEPGVSNGFAAAKILTRTHPAQ